MSGFQYFLAVYRPKNLLFFLKKEKIEVYIS